MEAFWSEKIPLEYQFFKPWNVGYQEWAVEKGLYDTPSPYVFDIYLEPLAEFQRAAKGLGPQNALNVIKIEY